MADEVLEETIEETNKDVTEGTTGEVVTEGTTSGNNYLTRKYLVTNLQSFWNKIKTYFNNLIEPLASKEFVRGQLDDKASKEELDTKADQTALESLTDTVANKADNSTLTALETELTEALEGKVDVVKGKGLSTNDFTNVFRDKLDKLPTDVATHSDMGFMSGTDKQTLDRLAENAVTEVDSTLSETSTNPVQNQVIYAELSNKVTKENPLDSSKMIGVHLSCEGNSNGDIILTLHDSTKHFKIHAETGEVIEKFYISRKDITGQNINFNTFGGEDHIVTIPNPDGNGNLETNKTYKFYVECFELLGTGKYEPFILKITRGSVDPIHLIPSII